MKKKVFVKIIRCPRCGSHELLNLEQDQMCLNCDWDNFKLLVDQGQLDALELSEIEQLGSEENASVGETKPIPKAKIQKYETQ